MLLNKWASCEYVRREKRDGYLHVEVGNVFLVKVTKTFQELLNAPADLQR